MKTKRRGETVSYKSVMDVIDTEYKEFDKLFAIGHYIQRRLVLHRFDTTGIEAKKIKIAEELLSLHRERKEVFVKANDYKPIRFLIKKIFFN